MSVVIPVFNEGANIAPLCARLTPVLERITPDWEIVFVDDGSADDTLGWIRAQAMMEPRIGAISFSRNFGKEIAIAAGLDHARGRAIVIMDADLQHPPEMIETFVERWREGYVMVYGQRVDRADESVLKRNSARLFYRLWRDDLDASSATIRMRVCGRGGWMIVAARQVGKRFSGDAR
ncbi:glycosyltransferase family 2 protein, partial [Roseicella aerolata]|uniref:glycosyltransferase family 2 protein n=1 Tax=Roseicella aerolata TaxID=2883479 RepID=UPI0021F6939D